MNHQAKKRPQGNLVCVILRERSPSEKGCTLRDPNSGTFWKRHNYRDSEESVVARGDRWEGRAGGAQEIFKTVQLLRVTPQRRIHVTRHFSKPTEWARPGGNPNVNYGVWGLMMGQCRVLFGEDHALPVSDINKGQCVHVWASGKFSAPSSQFRYKSEISLKRVSL